MSMAPTVQRYLADQGAVFDVVHHPLTQTSSETAQASHISGDRVAKAVVLRDGPGYLLAVVAASHHIKLAWLERWLGRQITLASEQEVGRLFPDCDLGAIPPIGQAYGLDVLLNESLAGQDEIYFEGGDHQCLIKMSREQFVRLMAPARGGTFSTHD
jgi:Ala-tRNA(Pro) deacylase